MYRDAGCSATRRPEDKITFQENSNGMRPISIIPLESDVVIERTVAVSVVEISIAPSIREVRYLLGVSNLIQMTM